jgi:hypothetical protein
MKLHGIDPDPSQMVRNACPQTEVAEQIVEATLELYKRKGFIPPWTGYLAEKDRQIVGICGFCGLPQNGEAELAYFTFPGNENKGIATQMAAALILESRRTASGEIFISHTDTRGRAIDYDSQKPGFECLGIIEHPDDGSIALSRFTGARGGFGRGEAHAKTRSREGSRKGRL